MTKNQSNSVFKGIAKLGCLASNGANQQYRPSDCIDLLMDACRLLFTSGMLVSFGPSFAEVSLVAAEELVA